MDALYFFKPFLWCVVLFFIIGMIGFIVSLVVGTYRLLRKKDSSVLVCGSLFSLFLIDFCIIVTGLLTYEPERYTELIWCVVGMPIIAWFFHDYCKRKNESA